MAATGVLVACVALQAGAADRTDMEPQFPVEDSFPEELLAPYDFDAPAGPAFTDAQIPEQLARGATLEDLIYAAYESGQDTLVIPPGHYRLRESGSVPLKKDRHRSNGTSAMAGAQIRLQGLRRPDDRPLHIIGRGVTIWFTPTGIPRHHVNFGIHLDDCANIIFDGFTFDAARPTTFGGKVTKIDAENRRVELQLSKASRTNLAQINDHGDRPWGVRIFPFNRKGRYMTATYKMSPGTWGPAYNAVGKVEPSDIAGRVWAYFMEECNGQKIDKSMLEIMQTPEWRSTYGPDNTLSPGCFIAGQWGVSVLLDVYNSRRITLANMTNYHPASFFSFEKGYGDHRIVNCKGLPRPDTCRLMGGYASGRIMDLEKGPLIDRLIQHHTEDDAYHICGHYYPLPAMNSRTMELQTHDGAGLRPGLTVDIYDPERRSALYRGLRITKVVSTRYQGNTGTVIEIDQPVSVPAGANATFPGLNNDGWVIRNSYFFHCYQRLLNQGGRDAVFENNYVEGLGEACCFPSSYDGTEGGRIDGVRVRGNIFIDSGIAPGGVAIHAASLGHFLEMSRGMTMRDNIIIGPGMLGIYYSRVIGGEVSDNIIVDPLALTATSVPGFTRPDKAMVIEQSSDVTARNNILIERREFTRPEPDTGDRFADISDAANRNVVSDGNRYIRDPDGGLVGRIRKIIAQRRNTDEMRRSIFEGVR
jgi:hypothetical protein